MSSIIDSHGTESETNNGGTNASAATDYNTNNNPNKRDRGDEKMDVIATDSKRSKVNIAGNEIRTGSDYASDDNDSDNGADNNNNNNNNNNSDNNSDNDDNIDDNDDEESSSSSAGGLAGLVGENSLSDGSDGDFEDADPDTEPRTLCFAVARQLRPRGVGSDGIDALSYGSMTASELRGSGADPARVLASLGIRFEVHAPKIPDPESTTTYPHDASDDFLWSVLEGVSMGMRVIPPRRKLPEFSTLEDAISLIRRSKEILVLTGAGVSVSCGIPDFRSKDGLYARLKERFDLPEPEAMFDMHYFRIDPTPFFSFAKDIYPGNFTPSPSHRFIRALQDEEKLRRNYTQNIDALEDSVGLDRKRGKILQCHGSFATATCLTCRKSYTAADIREDVMAQRVARCKPCMDAIDTSLEQDNLPWDSPIYAVIKPDITFFHENLDNHFHECVVEDRDDCDLVIAMGTSLQVEPVCRVINEVDPRTPQILINRNIVGGMNEFDVYLLGNADIIVKYLAYKLGYNIQEKGPAKGGENEDSEVPPEPEFQPPNIYLFEGAVYETPEQAEARRQAELEARLSGGADHSDNEENSNDNDAGDNNDSNNIEGGE